jgi:uncharacterized protein (TIGR03546 family)
MLRWIVKPLRILVESLRDEESPHLLALGLSLGMLVGLVPKDNLTATCLATLLLVLRLHLGAAASSALLFTWVGSLLDPLSHRIGLAILTFKPLEPFYSWLFDQPLVPWTNLNNTVVLGNLAIGLVLCYPCYRLAKGAVEKYGPTLIDRLQTYKLYHAIRGADVATTWRIP